jgi:UPF0288 family protein (methanogenesis marker protein 3)
MPLFKVIEALVLFLRPKRFIPENPEDAVEVGTVRVSRVTRVLPALSPFSLESSDGFCPVGRKLESLAGLVVVVVVVVVTTTVLP